MQFKIFCINKCSSVNQAWNMPISQGTGKKIQLCLSILEMVIIFQSIGWFHIVSNQEKIMWNSKFLILSKTLSHVITNAKLSFRTVCHFIRYQVIPTTRRQYFGKWSKCCPSSHKYKSRQLCGSSFLVSQICSRMRQHWAICLMFFEMQTGKKIRESICSQRSLCFFLECYLWGSLVGK